MTNAWLKRLLERCGLDLDPEELQAALDYYAGSWAKQTGAPLLFARTLFFDGFVHGLALASELDADPPSYYEEQG